MNADPLSSFQMHQRDVYVWAYRVLGRHHDAQDVLQDVFLRFSAQWREQAPDNARAWLRRVTINRALDVRKRRGRANAAPDVEAPIETKRDLAQHDELRAAIAAALDELTDAQRGVLVAKVYDELTFVQIARECDLAVPTVKTHYLRAVRAVRDRLARSGLTPAGRDD